VIVDTHCHLNFDIFHQDLEEVLNRAKAAGVGPIVIPATDLTTSREIVPICQNNPILYGAVGIHPNEAMDFRQKDIDLLRDLAGNDKIVAIGEIGLDKYHQDVELSQQIIAFEAQLELAEELNLPVLIHNREADDEVVRILKKWMAKKRGTTSSDNPVGIMHAFSSSRELAHCFCELGFCLGIAGPITYRNSIEKRELLREIDREKIVVETDSPFLSPVPFRGKRNEPAYTTHIVDEISRVWDITSIEVEEITTRNAFRIFKWTNLNQTM